MSALRSAQDVARALRADNRALRAENAALRAEVAALRAAARSHRAQEHAVAAPARAPAAVPAPPPALPSPVAVAVRVAPDAAASEQPRAVALARAAPSPAAAAPSLPVEVWVRVCAYCACHLDVLSLARTCRAAHLAACSRGAWNEVDLGSVEEEMQQRYYAATGPHVFDLTGAVPRNVNAWQRRYAGGKFAAFLAAHPCAASGITKLVLPVAEEQCIESVCALLPHCTRLKRLLGLNNFRPHSKVVAMLNVAAEANLPLEHAHVNVLTPDTCAVLPRLRSLCSFTYTHHYTEARARLEPGLDAALLESLIRRLRLTRLELEQEFLPSLLACPELTACSIDGFYNYFELSRISPEELYSTLFEGCPRLQCIGGLDKFRRKEQ